MADRNIWLRRQMIIVLRQIVKTMFGDTVNKRIVDYFASLTSVDAVSGYLNNIKVRLLFDVKLDTFVCKSFPSSIAQT